VCVVCVCGWCVCVVRGVCVCVCARVRVRVSAVATIICFFAYKNKIILSLEYIHNSVFPL